MQSCTSDAQCATQLPCKEGAQREVSGGSKDWFRFQLTDGQSLDLPLSQEKGRVQRDGGKNSSEVFLSCTTGLVSIGLGRSKLEEGTRAPAKHVKNGLEPIPELIFLYDLLQFP